MRAAKATKGAAHSSSRPLRILSPNSSLTSSPDPAFLFCILHWRELPQRGSVSPYGLSIAPQISACVAIDCPRYCGRNPYSTACPLPTVTSTSAALPFSFEPPSSQPESSGSPAAG